MPQSILRETTPLSEKDCFMLFSRVKKCFDFPLHVHAGFELNFIENASGAQRIVGDSIEVISEIELTLIASPDLAHGWFDHKCNSPEIKEITIQFHPNLLDDQLLLKNQLRSIKKMFDKAVQGVTFSEEVIRHVKPKIYDLASEKEEFYSFVNLLSLLYELSKDTDMRVLSSRSFQSVSKEFDSRRIEKVIRFISENYAREITLHEVGDLIGMSEVSFSRFLKLRTGRTFIDTLHDIRLGHATRLLIDTTHTISEISNSCGFNNLSNFNRIFLKKKGLTPTVFRDKYRNSKFYL